MLALLQGKYGGSAPPELMGPGEQQMDAAGQSPDMAADMAGNSPDQMMDQPMPPGAGAPMDPLAAAAGPSGPAGIPLDMATGGPMAASPLPTTDPGQLMAMISQMAGQDQQKAMMMALQQTKMMQAQAIQPVAASMLQQAMAQGATMDVGGGPVGGY
jgi:hypothetical protein